MGWTTAIVSTPAIAANRTGRSPGARIAATTSTSTEGTRTTNAKLGGCSTNPICPPPRVKASQVAKTAVTAPIVIPPSERPRA